MSTRETETPGDRAVETPKKEYCAPKVVHTEKMTGMATTCAMADSSCQTGGQTGPLQS
jgi:hypothetical protein